MSSIIFPAYTPLHGTHMTDRLKSPTASKHSFLVPAFKACQAEIFQAADLCLQSVVLGEHCLRKGCWTFQPVTVILLAPSKV